MDSKKFLEYCETGNLKKSKEMIANLGTETIKYGMGLACFHAQIKVMKFLLPKMNADSINYALDDAYHGNQFNCAKYLMKNGADASIIFSHIVRSENEKFFKLLIKFESKKYLSSSYWSKQLLAEYGFPHDSAIIIQIKFNRRIMIKDLNRELKQYIAYKPYRLR